MKKLFLLLSVLLGMQSTALFCMAEELSKEDKELLSDYLKLSEGSDKGAQQIVIKDLEQTEEVKNAMKGLKHYRRIFHPDQFFNNLNENKTQIIQILGKYPDYNKAVKEISSEKLSEDDAKKIADQMIKKLNETYEFLEKRLREIIARKSIDNLGVALADISRG